MKQINFSNDILPMKDQLFRLALRITLNREEAEDIVQETLIKIWNNRLAWSDIKSIEAYAMTICRNLSIDRQRQNSRQNEADTNNIADTHADNEPNPYEQLQQNDRINIIRNIMDALPEKQKSCLQLRDIEAKSYKEIAEIMAITEEQVKINIFRARQKLKEKLQTIDKYGL